MNQASPAESSSPHHVSNKVQKRHRTVVGGMLVRFNVYPCPSTQRPGPTRRNHPLQCGTWTAPYRNQLTCPSPILDRTPFSLSFIMLLAVHNGGGVRQPQQSQLPHPLWAAVLADYQVRLCRQISASSYDGSTRSSFVRCGANDVR
jgi:hypothetical protein